MSHARSLSFVAFAFFLVLSGCGNDIDNNPLEPVEEEEEYVVDEKPEKIAAPSASGDSATDMVPKTSESKSISDDATSAETDKAKAFDELMEAAMSGEGSSLKIGRGAGGMGVRGTGHGGGGEGSGRVHGLSKIGTGREGGSGTFSPRSGTKRADTKRKPARSDAPKSADLPGSTPKAGRLTAGEWRDLDHWSFWQELFVSGQKSDSKWASMVKHWGFDTSKRISVVVKDASGKAAVDVEVELSDAQQRIHWKARTDNKGRAELFVGIFEEQPSSDWTVVARSGAASASSTKVQPGQPLKLSLEAQPASNALDVMFVVDTTGSMDDELNYLKSELRSVMTDVQKKNGQQLEIRTSVNFFRDEGDEYTVRPFPFTKDLDTTLGQLAKQNASGGGDFPEAVDAALDNAINKHAWNPKARARLLFLVLDAPPHHNANSVKRLQTLSRKAAEAGIRIVPLAGSGIDKNTEFLMRFLSISTGGSYLFLTDHSGIGGSHVKPTIGPHKVTLLNQLLAEVINNYLT